MLEVDQNGLYCRRGDFHIDPWRSVPRAVISHAHSDHARSGSGQYFSSITSEGPLRLRLGATINLTTLAWGESHAFGDVKISLHPAGHVLGSAQIRLEADGEVWVFTGDYKRDPDPSCEPFEVVPCDVLITEATFGLPVYRWPQSNELRLDLYRWWQSYSEGPSILFCYAFGKSQRVLAELLLAWEADPLRSDAGQAPRVLLHGASVHLTQAYRDAGVRMLPTLPASEVPRTEATDGCLIIAPPSAHRSSWMKRFRRPQTAFASGWMQIRGNRRRRGYERGFVISDHVDWSGIISTIVETGARRVYVTHGQGGPLVRYLREELKLEAAELSTLYGSEGESESE